MSQSKSTTLRVPPFDPLAGVTRAKGCRHDWNRGIEAGQISFDAGDKPQAPNSEEEVSALFKQYLLNKWQVSEEDKDAACNEMRAILHQGSYFNAAMTPASAFWAKKGFMPMDESNITFLVETGNTSNINVVATDTGFTLEEIVTQRAMRKVEITVDHHGNEVETPFMYLPEIGVDYFYKLTTKLNFDFSVCPSEQPHKPYGPSNPKITILRNVIDCRSEAITQLLFPDPSTNSVQVTSRLRGKAIPEVDSIVECDAKKTVCSFLKKLQHIKTFTSKFPHDSELHKQASVVIYYLEQARKEGIKPFNKDGFVGARGVLIKDNLLELMDKTIDFLKAPSKLSGDELVRVAKTSPWRKNLGIALIALAAVVLIAAIVATIVLTAGVAAPVIAGGLGALAAPVSVGGVTATTGAVIGTAAGVGFGVLLGGLFSKCKAAKPSGLAKASEDLASVVKPSI